MSLVDVTCTRNSIPIEVTAPHVDGKRLTFVIDPARALIDKSGNIRFFTLDWDNGDVHGYLLHPYFTSTSPNDPVLQGISWTLGFLGGYGLSRTRGILMRQIPKTMHPAGAEAIQMGAYFLFSTAGAHEIKSFADHLFSKKHLAFGYHNILTDKLIWPTTLLVQKW